MSCTGVPYAIARRSGADDAPRNTTPLERESQRDGDLVVAEACYGLAPERKAPVSA